MKIAYVFTEIPEIRGAFPNAELDEMAARGLSIEIFILRNRRPQTDEGRRIEGRFIVHRSPYFLSAGLIASVLATTIRHPILVARTLVQTIRTTATVPMVLIKSLAILPKAIHYAVIARRRDVTLIHAYWVSLPALAASVMARFSGRSFTTWAHAGADIYNKRFQTDAALLARLREARRVFTCNRVNLEHFADLAGPDVLDKVRLLTHGVDTDEFQAIAYAEPTGKPRLLAVGRLSPAKGYDVLIRSCDLLRRRGCEFVCQIAGTGVMEGSLRQLALSLACSDTVCFLGHVDHADLPTLYRDATIFVAPSVVGPKGSRDGLPNVLLEAMAAGVACVGSKVASIPEVIQEGRTGVLVPPGDPEALADAIEGLLGDPPTRRRLAAAGAVLVRVSYDRTSAMDRLHEEFIGLHKSAGVRARKSSA